MISDLIGLEQFTRNFLQFTDCLQFTGDCLTIFTPLPAGLEIKINSMPSLYVCVGGRGGNEREEIKQCRGESRCGRR